MRIRIQRLPDLDTRELFSMLRKCGKILTRALQPIGKILADIFLGILDRFYDQKLLRILFSRASFYCCTLFGHNPSPQLRILWLA